MALHNIKSYYQLSFDEDQEADIINFMEELCSSHKAGQFLSMLIRVAFDCPEVFDKNKKDFNDNIIKKLVDNTGKMYNRQAFFNNISKETSDMHNKIDKMYSMILNMYILSQMGKTLGLEDKSKNALMAQFIVEKQFKELQDLVGESLNGNVLASNKLQNTQKIAEDALQLIIESYSGIVDELKQSQVVQYVETRPTVSTEDTTTDVSNEDNNKEVQEVSNDNSTQDSEYIDFGDADVSALADFFGDSQ